MLIKGCYMSTNGRLIDINQPYKIVSVCNMNIGYANRL